MDDNGRQQMVIDQNGWKWISHFRSKIWFSGFMPCFAKYFGLKGKIFLFSDVFLWQKLDLCVNPIRPIIMFPSSQIHFSFISFCHWFIRQQSRQQKHWNVSWFCRDLFWDVMNTRRHIQRKNSLKLILSTLEASATVSLNHQNQFPCVWMISGCE